MSISTSVSPRLLDNNRTSPSKVAAECSGAGEHCPQQCAASTPTFVEACGQCDEEAVAAYLKDDGANRASLNARDKTGKTGLSHACANGFTSIVKLIQQKQNLIDVNLADNEGNTPLIFASQAGHFDIVKLLVNKFSGVNVDQCNNQGFTALMKAAIQGRSRCAKILLYAGSSPHKRDFGRRLCAVEWAEYCSRLYCAKTIMRFVEAYESGLMCRENFPVNGADWDNSEISIHEQDPKSHLANESTKKKNVPAQNSGKSAEHKKLDRHTNSDFRVSYKQRCRPVKFSDDSDNDSCEFDPTTTGCVPLCKSKKDPYKVAEAQLYANESEFLIKDNICDMSKFLFLPALAMGANFSRGQRSLRGFSPAKIDLKKERRSRSLMYRKPDPPHRPSSRVVYSRASTPGGGSSPTSRFRRLQVPKVKVTLISKDDNFYCEKSLRDTSRFGSLASKILRKISL